MLRIVLVTDADHLELTQADQLYAAALSERGCTVTAERWDDPSWQDDEIDLIVVRSPWDTWQSPDRVAAFDRFLDRLATRPPGSVENDPSLLRLGGDKASLIPLAASADVHIPETAVIADPTDAASVVEGRGWAAGVAKPRFGGSGWGVELVRPDIDWVATDTGWIVQEHMSAIADGEIDLAVIDGEVTHAVRKVPAEGEWRTNWRFKPHWTIDEPPPAAVETARRIIAALPTVPLYARVDGVMDGERFVLIEVELVSPTLFLTMHPPAAGRLADATIARLGNANR